MSCVWSYTFLLGFCASWYQTSVGSDEEAEAVTRKRERERERERNLLLLLEDLRKMNLLSNRRRSQGYLLRLSMKMLVLGKRQSTENFCLFHYLIWKRDGCNALLLVRLAIDFSKSLLCKEETC